MLAVTVSEFGQSVVLTSAAYGVASGDASGVASGVTAIGVVSGEVTSES